MRTTVTLCLLLQTYSRLRTNRFFSAVRLHHLLDPILSSFWWVIIYLNNRIDNSLIHRVFRICLLFMILFANQDKGLECQSPSNLFINDIVYHKLVILITKVRTIIHTTNCYVVLIFLGQFDGIAIIFSETKNMITQRHSVSRSFSVYHVFSVPEI